MGGADPTHLHPLMAEGWGQALAGFSRNTSGPYQMKSLAHEKSSVSQWMLLRIKNAQGRRGGDRECQNRFVPFPRFLNMNSCTLRFTGGQRCCV